MGFLARVFGGSTPPPEKPRPSRRGGAGTRVNFGIVDNLDQNAEVRGTRWRGSPGVLGLCQQMMRDPHVRRSVEAVHAPLVAANWRFRAASKEPIDREIADFCQWAFIERLHWSEIMRRMIGGYATAGFALGEMTDDLAPIPATRFALHPGGGQGIVPTDIHEIPAWSVLRWQQDKAVTSRIAGVEQQIAGSDAEPLSTLTVPADRILRMTWDQEGANYEGLAILRSAYGAWKLKLAFSSIDAIKHERTGVGTPSITMPENVAAEDIAAAEAILSEMRVHEKGYLLLPSGYKFEWTSATGNDGTNINEAIERCNKDIAHNVAAGFTLLGLTGKTGSYALASTQEGQYHLSSEAHAKFYASAWNIGFDGWSPVKRIVELNYGPDAALPILEARNLPTRDWLAVVDATNRSVSAGTVVADDPLEDEIRAALQLGPRDPETSREKAPLPGAGVPVPGAEPSAPVPPPSDPKSPEDQQVPA